MLTTLALLLLAGIVQLLASSMPAPFTRELKLTSPPMTGNDVLIAQTLLLRDSAVDKSVPTSGVYDEATAKGCSEFQSAHSLKPSGKLDSQTAQLLMNLHSADGYKDSGFTAASMGYLYKFHIPVHSNRSVETYATLFDANNNELLKFRVRTHGHRDDGSSDTWPDFGNGDVGYTEYGSSGNTVTGLVEIDLNSPEPDPALYGPYPINRIVRGLDGNAKLLLPNIRDGLLIHTGDWSTAEHPWDSSMDMPNSSGCVHAHPEDIERVYNLLLSIGVKVHDNTYSGKNYPYKAQGVGVIELVD